MDGFQFTSSIVSALAWPVALVLCVIVFRKKLTEILPNLKVKHKETELSFRKEQQDATTSVEFGLDVPTPPAPPQESSSPAPPLPYTDPPAPSVATVMNTIETQLKNYAPESRDLILVREVASAQLLRAFEAIFAEIFDSQIRILRHLSSRATMPLNDAEEYFKNTVQIENPILNEWDVERWLKYPVSHGLIKETQDNLAITALGRDFLTFIDTFKAHIRKSL